MFDLESYLADLKTITAMDTGRYNEEGVREIVAWFRERYDALGFQTEVTELAETDGHYAPVLLVSNLEEEDILESTEKFDVLTISHLDTVFDTEDLKTFTWKMDPDGILHAPGCVDCKGGSLLVYYLLKDMLAEGTLNFRFVAAMNTDEEPGSNYSREFFEVLADRTTYCLVFEPGRANDEFVGVRKGGVKYHVIAHGVGAHSGVDFEKGANAIVELARWIPKIYELTDLKKGTTLNVAKLDGGLNNGQVPDYADAYVRLLYLEPEEVDRVNAFFDEMVKNPVDTRCSLEVEVIGTSRPPMYINENSEALLKSLNKAGEQTGCKTDWVTTGGMSDGNWVAHHNVGTLDGCGPCGANLHTYGEYMKTWTVKERFDIMRQLLINLFV